MTSPARPNRRELSAIEADIHGTLKKDAASLIKRGEYLIEAKESEHIAHGDWTSWLSKNFDLSERTAQSQMQVARFVGGLSKTAKFAVLNLSKSVLYEISADDYCSADCIPAILEEAATSPRPLTPRGLKAVIAAYREAHKTPEEREAERVAAVERQALIAKVNLQWVEMPDDEYGNKRLQVETPHWIYKLWSNSSDTWHPERHHKDSSLFSPLVWNGVSLDEAKAACAKDEIEAQCEAEEKAAHRDAASAEQAEQADDADEEATEAEGKPTFTECVVGDAIDDMRCADAPPAMIARMLHEANPKMAAAVCGHLLRLAEGFSAEQKLVIADLIGVLIPTEPEPTEPESTPPESGPKPEPAEPEPEPASTMPPFIEGADRVGGDRGGIDGPFDRAPPSSQAKEPGSRRRCR